MMTMAIAIVTMTAIEMIRLTEEEKKIYLQFDHLKNNVCHLLTYSPNSLDTSAFDQVVNNDVFFLFSGHR